MNRSFLFLWVAAQASVALLFSLEPPTQAISIEQFVSSRDTPEYPATKTVEVEDVYFGKTYKDPYRWLEEIKSSEVEDWFKAQATLADRILRTIPGSKHWRMNGWHLDKMKPRSYSEICYDNGRVFYKKTLGGENVSKLFVRKGWDGDEELLFDPTTYSSASNTVLQSFIPSRDGEHVVIGLTAKGPYETSQCVRL